MNKQDDVVRRIEALEVAVAELVGSVSAGSAPATPGRLWVLYGIRERHPEGAVMLAGAVEVDGAPVEWQYGAAADQFHDEEWSTLAPTFDALGHPVRLQLLQLVFTGVRTTAELAAQESLGSTGQVHHHLRILVSAGWLVQRARGSYEIPGPRVIPLLVTLLAARPA